MTAQSYRKILMVNTFGIGDVLFTTPVIKNIKQQWPGAAIGYVANQRTAPMLERNQLVDQVFVYERDEFDDLWQASRIGFFKKAADLLAQIRAQGYELALDFSLNTPTGLLLMLAGIPERVGYDYKGRGKFLTRRIPLAGYEDKHVVEYYLDLLRALGWQAAPYPMSFPLFVQDRVWVDNLMHDYELEDSMVVIVPGGGASWGKDAVRKQWPVEYFAQLADRLIDTYGVKIVFAGGPQDREFPRKIFRLMKGTALDLSGRLDLFQSAALFSRSQLTIVNDGGPLHVAVACGAKTVSIFGPVDERVYGPYPAQGHPVVVSKIACRPCYRRFRVAQCGHLSCLRHLSVDEVFEVVKGILLEKE